MTDAETSPLLRMAAPGALTHLFAMVGTTCILFVVAWLCFSPSLLSADPVTWYVSPGGTDSNSCTVAGAPCRHIQAALDRASDGDTINVAQGVYTETSGPVAFIVADITLRGGWNASFVSRDAAAYPTYLDGQGLHQVVVLKGPSASLPVAPEIRGFIITQGNGDDAIGCTPVVVGGCGGGIFGVNATPYIVGNTIVDNVGATFGTGFGGGIYLEGRVAGGIIEGNVISGNVAAVSSTEIISGWGGGIALYYAKPLIRDNLVQENIASASAGVGYGGGIALYRSSAQVIDNRLFSNMASVLATYTTWAGAGGGISVIQVTDDQAEILSNTLRNNMASLSGHGYGGAIHAGSSNVLVQGNLLVANTSGLSPANGDGGGFYGRYGNWEIRDNTIVSNTSAAQGQGFGGGCQLEWGRAIIEKNYIAGNTSTKGARPGFGGGINLLHCDGSVVRGNIIRDNVASVGGTGYGGGVSVRFGTVTVDGNQILYNRPTANTIYHSWGGGVRVERVAPVTLTNNVIAYNQAHSFGGGLLVFGDPVVGALGTYGVLIHNTFVENVVDGGAREGIYVTKNATVVMTNNIVVSQSYGILCEAGCKATLDSTLFYGNEITDVQGTITARHTFVGTPAFVDPSNDDFHIKSTSSAFDVGVATRVYTDMDGEMRPFGAWPDLGADELHLNLSPLQCQADYSASLIVHGLEAPDGLAFSPSGELYVAEERAGRVSRIGAGGEITPVVLGLSNPEGIAFDATGNLYIVEDVEAGRLVKVTPIGGITTLVAGLDAPEGVVWTADGLLYVTESKAQFVTNPLDNQTGIVAVSPTGVLTTVLTDTWRLSYAGIASGPGGMLYVTNEAAGVSVTDSVLAVNPATGDHSLFVSGLVAPEGLRFSSAGDFPLYVVAEGTGGSDGTLSMIDADGTVSIICTGFYGAEDVVLDRRNNLYVTDDGRGVIILIKPLRRAYLPLVLKNYKVAGE